jgi:hypothetical protein
MIDAGQNLRNIGDRVRRYLLSLCPVATRRTEETGSTAAVIALLLTSN